MAQALRVRPGTVELSTRSFAVSVTEWANGPDPNPYSNRFPIRPKLSVRTTEPSNWLAATNPEVGGGIVEAVVGDAVDELESVRNGWRLAAAAEAIARERRLPFHLSCARILLGWCLSQEGAHEEALREVRAGIRTSLLAGARMEVPLFLAVLAECLNRAGDREGAGGAR